MTRCVGCGKTLITEFHIYKYISLDGDAICSSQCQKKFYDKVTEIKKITDDDFLQVGREDI